MTRLPKGLRPLARTAAADGWRWRHLGSGHIEFFNPRARGTVTASGTSRDANAHRILKRQMRRALEAN